MVLFFRTEKGDENKRIYSLSRKARRCLSTVSCIFNLRISPLMTSEQSVKMFHVEATI